MTDEYRMYFLVRRDLKMGRGKIAAQVAHAAMSLTQKMMDTTLCELTFREVSKIALYVESFDEMEDYMKACAFAGLPTCMIVDGGRTQVAPHTPTVVGVGPLPPEEWHRFSNLKLVN